MNHAKKIFTIFLLAQLFLFTPTAVMAAPSYGDNHNNMRNEQPQQHHDTQRSPEHKTKHYEEPKHDKHAKAPKSVHKTYSCARYDQSTNKAAAIITLIAVGLGVGISALTSK